MFAITPKNTLAKYCSGARNMISVQSAGMCVSASFCWRWSDTAMTLSNERQPRVCVCRARLTQTERGRHGVEQTIQVKMKPTRRDNSEKCFQNVCHWCENNVKIYVTIKQDHKKLTIFSLGPHWGFLYRGWLWWMWQWPAYQPFFSQFLSSGMLSPFGEKT